MHELHPRFKIFEIPDSFLTARAGFALGALLFALLLLEAGWSGEDGGSTAV